MYEIDIDQHSPRYAAMCNRNNFSSAFKVIQEKASCTFTPSDVADSLIKTGEFTHIDGNDSYKIKFVGE